MENLKDDRFEVFDIWISRKGVWHHNGFEISSNGALTQLDMAINALSGVSRENVQRMFEMHSLPYIGPRRMDALLVGNRSLFKKHLEESGLNISLPKHKKIGISESVYEQLFDFFRSSLPPTVVKPIWRTSGLGVSVAHSFEELKKSAREAFEYSSEILLEEYVRGKKISCIVVDNYRNETLYVSPLVESDSNTPTGKRFPASLFKEEKHQVESLARSLHEQLNLRDYSKVDFMFSPKKGVCVLEVEPLPWFFYDSSIKTILEGIGSSEKELMTELIEKRL